MEPVASMMAVTWIEQQKIDMNTLAIPSLIVYA